MQFFEKFAWFRCGPVFWDERFGLLGAQDFAHGIGDGFLVPLFFEVVELADQMHHASGVDGFVLESIAELAKGVSPAGQ